MANTKIKLTSNKMVECKQVEKILVGSIPFRNYELRAVGFDREKLETAIMREYRKAYKEWYGCKPDKEEVESARSGLGISEFDLYEVIWD